MGSLYLHPTKIGINVRSIRSTQLRILNVACCYGLLLLLLDCTIRFLQLTIRFMVVRNDDVDQVRNISKHRALLGSQLVFLNQGGHRPPLRRSTSGDAITVQLLGHGGRSHCSALVELWSLLAIVARVGLERDRERKQSAEFEV